MKSPLISICIPHFNGIDLIDACIDSVRKQACDAAIEIIVHDDASTDGSAEYIRTHHSDIRLITSSENVGFCVANNRMAKQARGEYLLLLNNDAALAPDALESLLAAACAQTPQGILSLPQHDWESGELIDRGCLLDPFYNPVPNPNPARRDVAMVIGACLWLPRTLWEELGGFPEWFESIAEDMYLCCRARLASYPVQVTTTSYYRHRQGKSFGGNRITGDRLASTYRRRRLSERNKTFVMILCSPPLRLLFTLPLHVLLLAMEGVLLAFLNRDVRLWTEIYVNVFDSLIEKADMLWQVRRQIQITRQSSGNEYGRGFTWMSRKLQLLIRHGVPSLR